LDKETAQRFLPNSKYIWCLHCERVDMKSGWVNNYGYCPYEDCDGSAIDGWSWSKVQKFNPQYPSTPEYDIVYPLYSEEKTSSF